MLCSWLLSCAAMLNATTCLGMGDEREEQGENRWPSSTWWLNQPLLPKENVSNTQITLELWGGRWSRWLTFFFGLTISTATKALFPVVKNKGLTSELLSPSLLPPSLVKTSLGSLNYWTTYINKKCSSGLPGIYSLHSPMGAAPLFSLGVRVGGSWPESCSPTFLPSETSQLAYRKESKFLGMGYK